MHDHRDAERGATILTALLAIAAILAAALVTLNVVASVRTKRVQAKWESTLGTRDDVFARNPTTSANAAALELERVAARLGLELAPRSSEGRSKATSTDRERHEAIKQEIGEYGRRELERADSSVEPPPPAVAAYLAERAELIAEVRRLLIDGELPRWESEFSKLAAAPIPNLLGNIHLAKLLTADAYAQIAAGRPELADEDLRAVWRLGSSLRDTPILINQLIALAEARFVVGALRQLEPVDEAWDARLVDHDYLESMTSALRHDGWVLSQYATQSADTEDDVLERLLDAVFDPFTRIKLAGAADAFRQRLAEIDGIDALCDGAIVPAFDEPSRETGGLWGLATEWVPGTETYVANLTSTIHRVARFEMELELTRKLLELERSRRDGVWPQAAPGIERSDVCPNERWVYEVDASGTMRLAFERGELSWPGMKGARLPNHVIR